MFKYQVWKNQEPVVLCDTLEEAESRMKEYGGDAIEWVCTKKMTIDNP